MLKTCHRERRLLQTYLEIGQNFVIDNTNPTVEERVRYIGPAVKHGYQVIGYYFKSKLAQAIERNCARTPPYKIPEQGIGGTYGRLKIPQLEEGFYALY
jgi:predicted kinase